MFRVRTIITAVAGGPYYTNLHFDGDTSVAAQGAVDALRTFWTNVRGNMTGPASINIDPFCPVIDPASGDVTGGFTVNPGAPLSISPTEPALPRMVQGLITFSTGQYANGREIKGRMFLPCMQEAGNSALGVPEASLVANVQPPLNTLLATGPDLVVWSRSAGQFAAVASASMSTSWSVLRSRRS